MANTPRRKENETFVSFNKRQIGTLLAGITAIALLSFALGFLFTKMLAAPEAEEPAREEAAAPSYSLIKPKQLDADKIIGGSGEKTEPPAAMKDFTFPETLTEETAPAVDPFNPPKTAPQTQGKAASEKTETRKEPEKVKTAVSAPAPQVPVKTTEKPKPEPAPSPRKEAGVASEAKAAAKPGKELTIQVGSFASRQDAEKLKDRLVKKDFNAYVQTFNLKGKTWHRVRVGIFKTESSARREAKRLEESEKLPTLIVTYQRG